mmetsp:Transcript_14349/g.41865  ORF Transcript_14349/g.41865 Transcript_14349/m.41865 type:complete len:277 (+) Transcript_14349:865-1695(+)
MSLQYVTRPLVQFPDRGPIQHLAALLPTNGEIVGFDMLKQHFLPFMNFLLFRHGVIPRTDGPRHLMFVAQFLKGRLAVLRRKHNVVAAASSAGDRPRALHFKRESVDLPGAGLPHALELLHISGPIQKDLERDAPVRVIELATKFIRIGLCAGVRHVDLVLSSGRALPKNVLHWLEREALPFLANIHVHVEVAARTLLVAVENVVDLSTVPIALDVCVQIQVARVVPEKRHSESSCLRPFSRLPTPQTAEVQRQRHCCQAPACTRVPPKLGASAPD